MKVRINGVKVHLPSLTDEQLQKLLNDNGQRALQLREESDMLRLELFNRHNPKLPV